MVRGYSRRHFLGKLKIYILSPQISKDDDKNNDSTIVQVGITMCFLWFLTKRMCVGFLTGTRMSQKSGPHHTEVAQCSGIQASMRFS